MLNAPKTVEECFNPSTSSMFTGLGDDVYNYPSGQRTYTFAGANEEDAKNLGADAPAIKVVKNNIQLTLVGTVTFYLETADCDRFKSFHSNIGVKDWGGHAAWISEGDGDADYNGWNAMLDTYIGQPLQRAATDSILESDSGYLDVYNGTNRAAVEKDIQTRLPGAVKNLSGEEYFKGFNVQLQKPDIDQSLKDSLKQLEEAVNQNNAQAKRNETVNTELDSIRALVAVLGPDGYIAYTQNKLTEVQIDLLKQAVEKGNIQVLPVPTGSGVSLPVPAGK